MDDDGLQYDSGYDSEVLNTGHWGYGRPKMSKNAKDTLAFAKERLEHLLRTVDAPDIAEAPDFPPDAGVKACKLLTTAHHRLLKEQAPFVQLTDKHLVQAARREFRKHAEQWGVAVRFQSMRKQGRKSCIYHTHVRLLKCNQERYRRWAAERVAAEAAEPAVEVKREREEATVGRADAKRVRVSEP